MLKTNSTQIEDASLLVKPKMKNNCNFPELYPFPIVRDSFKDSVAWNCVIGYLKDTCVEVSDEENMELLFSMGFFGKGTLSRSTPQSLEKKLKERFGANKRDKAKQKQDVQEKDENSATDTSDAEDSTEKDEKPLAKRRKKDEIEVVLSDTAGEESDSSANIVVTSSKSDAKEALQLSFEEAFFLSYGLGVLIVKDKDQPLDLMRMWNKFCELQPNQNFPVMYTAYHHFRSKGWIVRSGTKYGTDFALYKDGPPFYHSSYVVIVKPVKEQNLRDIPGGGRPNLTWSSLAGLNRMCTHVSKAVIILYVIKPTTISENKISTPFCVSQYKLEMRLLPWLALLVVSLQCVRPVASQQDLPLWSSGLSKEQLLRPYLLDVPLSSSSVESTDYEGSQKSSYSPSSRQSSASSALKKRVAAMGVDLPDYILHYRGKSPDLGSFRERMQLSGRR